MTEFEREVDLVVGKTGHGKTYWTQRYIRDHKRVIILDPMLEYDGEMFEDPQKLIDYIEDKRVYQVRMEYAEDAGNLAKIAMAAAGPCQHKGKPMPHRGCRDVTLVIDEAGRALPSGGKHIDPAIEDVIYRGRHFHVTLVNVTQRASTLSIAARSQWTRLISFWQTEDADVKWVQSQAGEKLDLEHLRKLEYFDITPYGIRKMKINPEGVNAAKADTELTEDRDSERVS